MKKTKIATTFGASMVKDQLLYTEGVELGKFLAQKGYVIKCGGYGGLMEAISKGAKEAGGKIIGIALEQFDQELERNQFLDEVIIAKNLYERLKLLIENSELFVIQKGSIGTLCELFTVWTLKYALNLNARICLIGYGDLKNNSLIPKERLNDIEIYDSLNAFKESF